eukprot:1441839-Amphidinium_carterae.1
MPVKARWVDYRMLRREWLGSDTLPSSSSDAALLTSTSLKKTSYDYISITDLLKMEGSSGLVDVWQKYYVDDAYFNDSVVDDRPPVSRVLSIHGANLMTDVGYAIRLHTCRFIPSIELRSRFVLDTEAKLSTPDNTRTLRAGTIYEVASKSTAS